MGEKMGGFEDGLFGQGCVESEDLIAEGEIVSLLVGGFWLWGGVSAVDDGFVTLGDVSVVDSVGTPPRRGGKTATAGLATVRVDAVQAVVRGVFQQWEQ